MTRYAKPMSSAITHVSPTAPPRTPRNMSSREGRPLSAKVARPSLLPARTSSGVALVTRSTPFGIAPPATCANETSRNTRAVMAGFAKLWPRPPNRHLTNTIANTLPSTHCHTGTLVLRFRPSSRPVTTALRSPMDCLRCVITLKRNSETTAAITHERIGTRALMPKITIAAIVAGSRAMITSSMMRCVLAPQWVNGEEGVSNRLSIIFSLLPYDRPCIF